MTYDKRGKIQYRERARQIIDFSGLQYDKITPTDIDGLIEYKGKAYVFVEMKYSKAPIPYGQRLALERLVQDLTKSGKLATVFLCEHYVSDCEQDIDAKKTIVRSCYFNNKWRTDGKRTLKERLDNFIRFADSL